MTKEEALWEEIRDRDEQIKMLLRLAEERKDETIEAIARAEKAEGVLRKIADGRRRGDYLYAICSEADPWGTSKP